MSEEFDKLAESLETLSQKIVSTIPHGDDFIDHWGWNTPVLNRDQISERVHDLYDRVTDIPDEQQTDQYRKWVKEIPAKIDKFIANSLPQLAGSNAGAVLAVLEPLISYIEGRIPPRNWPIEWEKAIDAGYIPVKLARNLRSLEARIKALEPRSGDLEGKIQQIESAHAAAESLPTDLQSLQEARDSVAALAKELEKLASDARLSSETSATNFELIKTKSTEADKLMSNIDSAYRASTSKALADAFAKRSLWLQAQTWVWVVLLMLALGAGGYLGFRRVSALETLLTSGQQISAAVIWLNLAISFFSVAAPVWFAWVATKQISQRFKLAEDYGFKAAVAKAYEGYRREAAAIDPQFATRLFGSALSRLEEAPLRLVDEDNHGSPFHELTASPAFRQALSIVPALKEKYHRILSARKKQIDPATVSSTLPVSSQPTSSLSDEG